jgi:aldehyde:ferredoxin oxidoreductase
MKSVWNTVLDIDLNTSAVKRIPVTLEYRKLYLGGKGLAVRLLYDHLEPGIDALSSKNVLIFMTGPLSGTGAPSADKFVVVTKSPLTGIAASSSCGGSFGYHLKRAGYDGLLVRGKAPSPVFINITEEQIKIESAQHLWGLETNQTLHNIAKKNEGAVVIGPAGENMVRYACVRSDDRFAGRGGAGAVMGSKNLKAIVVHGSKCLKVDDRYRFKQAVLDCKDRIKKSPLTGQSLSEYGTPAWVNLSNEFNILPTKNFFFGRFDNAEQISGEYIREHYFDSHTGCHGCFVKCGKLLRLKGTVFRSPEYGGISALGSNLMISKAEEVILLNDLCNRLGLDVISTGVVLGFCMEMHEKGLLDFNLRFGNADSAYQAIENIAYQKKNGRELSNGVRWLSEQYGGKEFALHGKGLEMTQHDPRGIFGDGLAYATANRGACHLSGNTFATDLLYGLMDPHSIKGKPEWVKFTQDAMDFINSLILCSFITIPLFLEDPSLKIIPLKIRKLIAENFPGLSTKFSNVDLFLNLLSAATGVRFFKKDCLEIGERIFNLERLINVREGIDARHDTLPYRICEEVLPDSTDGPIPLKKLLSQYYKIRDWDHNGIPMDKKLHELRIAY